ncbi:unnamed protein product [Brachionus calyciflorus]|uniref:snRNA-activating protein complex subunit 1 n=1 Tax=Brachionus calyciflorus TaxID=104777 RepID=A0A813UKS0_9BILA|nr:unnamed protein product [Brachionus calyciflorus]
MQSPNNLEKDFNYYFRQDLLKLLNNFYQLKTYRFEDFLSIWNQMKFYQLFSIPRFFPFDYRFFMKDVLKIGCEYLYDQELYPEVRTGALYTLYAIYCNQSNRPRQKIPVTPLHWIEILKFIDFINQAEHVDVEYSFRYLLHSDAFEFCSSFEIKNRSISTFKVGNQHKNPLRINNEETSTDFQLNMTDFKEIVFNDELNEQMGTIHEAYLQCKDELAKVSKSSGIYSCINTDFNEIIGENLLKDLENEINSEEPQKRETVHEKIKRKILEKIEMEDDETPKTSRAKERPRATTRLRRQLNTLIDDNKNEDELEVENDEDSEDDVDSSFTQKITSP